MSRLIVTSSAYRQSTGVASPDWTVGQKRDAAENLGLPEIRGLAAHSEAWRGSRRTVLDIAPDRLGALLPLDPAVSSEVRALSLENPAQPALLTHDGARCLLDAKDWNLAQKRLGMVLADLAARRRRASLIDLRYDGTAVVRPLGR